MGAGSSDNEAKAGGDALTSGGPKFSDWCRNENVTDGEREHLPSSRNDAKRIGSKHYFTGIQCARGHIEKRLTSNGQCMRCGLENALAYAKKNSDKVAARMKEYRDKNSEKLRADGRAYYVENAETRKANSKKYYLDNADEIRRKARQYHAENREARIAARKRWAAENPEKYLASKRASDKKAYDKNPEKMREQAKARRAKYLQEKPELIAEWSRTSSRNRRARQRSVVGSHTSDDIARIRVAQRDRCAYCRAKLNGGGHVDHIIAIAKGGSNWPSNLQLLCEPCNRSKSALDPIEFMQKRGRLL